MICEITFDKDNKQKDYEYMAKDMNGEYVIGFLWIDRPWYTTEDQWTYYIRHQKYNNKGICGGAESSGFKDVIIDPNTIEPYTQIAEIKYNQSRGDTTVVEEFDKNIFDIFDYKELFRIEPNDRIPIEKWNIK